MFLECRIAKRFLGADKAFDLNVDFAASSSSVVFFGPSGSGKSLTMLALAGLVKPQSGYIVVNERRLFDSNAGIHIPTRKRRVGFVFQDYALFPHLSVYDNVAFGLKRLFRPFSMAQKRKVEELLELFCITPISRLRPHQISGGQRQRTALARALVCDPELVLLDEPFSALDQPLRARMREELARIRQRYRIPIVMVSHDFADVDAFVTTLVTFSKGRALKTIDYASLRAEGQNSQAILEPFFEEDTLMRCQID
jgi:molybdate transport system ATP-binding protein